MKAMSPVEESYKKAVNYRKIKNELKETLDIAMNIEDYAYHFATQNLKHNKLRYASTRKNFTNGQINHLLNLVKMGKNFDLYKLLTKDKALVGVTDSLGRGAVHWAVIRNQVE